MGYSTSCQPQNHTRHCHGCRFVLPLGPGDRCETDTSCQSQDRYRAVSSTHASFPNPPCQWSLDPWFGRTTTVWSPCPIQFLASLLSLPIRVQISASYHAGSGSRHPSAFVSGKTLVPLLTIDVSSQKIVSWNEANHFTDLKKPHTWNFTQAVLNALTPRSASHPPSHL